MAQFLITYDNKSPRNYTALYRLMAGWNAVRLADSVWLANLVGPAHVVRNIVQGTMQLNDRVAVLELQPGSDWATSRVDAAASTWLATYITPAQMVA